MSEILKRVGEYGPFIGAAALLACLGIVGIEIATNTELGPWNNPIVVPGEQLGSFERIMGVILAANAFGGIAVGVKGVFFNK